MLNNMKSKFVRSFKKMGLIFTSRHQKINLFKSNYEVVYIYPQVLIKQLKEFKSDKEIVKLFLLDSPNKCFLENDCTHHKFFRSYLLSKNKNVLIVNINNTSLDLSNRYSNILYIIGQSPFAYSFQIIPNIGTPVLKDKEYFEYRIKQFFLFIILNKNFYKLTDIAITNIYMYISFIDEHWHLWYITDKENYDKAYTSSGDPIKKTNPFKHKQKWSSKKRDIEPYKTNGKIEGTVFKINISDITKFNIQNLFDFLKKQNINIKNLDINLFYDLKTNILLVQITNIWKENNKRSHLRGKTTEIF
jgi:hypothetical protein